MQNMMVKKYLDERGLKILAALDQVSGKLHSTPGKVAIAWLMARPSVTAPIASATNVEQLKDLVDLGAMAGHLIRTELGLTLATGFGRVSNHESGSEAC